jgi:diphthamide synthase subunit DPH2
MIVMLLLLSGCANTPVDNFCLWAKPITISQEELAGAMSMETLRQIDNYNQEWEARCGNNN